MRRSVVAVSQTSCTSSRGSPARDNDSNWQAQGICSITHWWPRRGCPPCTAVPRLIQATTLLAVRIYSLVLSPLSFASFKQM